MTPRGHRTGPPGLPGDAPRPDAGGYDAFVAAQGTRLLRTAVLLTGDADAAEQLLRDTLVRAWQRWRRAVATEQPLAYVRAKLVRAAVRGGPSRRWTGPPAAGPGTPDEAVTAVASLPGNQRAVVVLSFHEHLDDAEIADLLGVPPRTVARRRARALASLQDRLGVRHGLEARLRADLASARPDRSPAPAGTALRGVAGDRRARTVRAVAGAATALALTGGGYLAAGGPGPEFRREPVGLPTPPPTAEARPEASWRGVDLPAGSLRRARAAAGTATAMRPVVATRLPSSSGVAVMFAGRTAEGELAVATATLDSDRPGAAARSGTAGRYRSFSSLVAQPVRDGDATVLMVLLPPGIGDTVQVTSSEPGRPLLRTSAFAEDRMALVPVAAPDAVTRVAILRTGRTSADLIPAASGLGPDVPRTLDRVAATTGDERPERPVQVRTDGRTACRLTAGGWWGDDPPLLPWNPVDSACAQVDGGLRLLLGTDRRAGSVAGVAPPGTALVRLHWRDGSVSAVRTSDDDVNAFVGPVARAADRLVRADAVGPDGSVTTTERP